MTGMGVALTEQAVMFFRSVMLGGVLALCYDLFRALRGLGGVLWGGVLDGAYCLLSAAALFLFVMAGDGELRLFFLAGALGGAVLFFCLLSQILRPLWDFWLLILLSPARLAAAAVKKCWRTGRKLFFRGKKWVTMGYARYRDELLRFAGLAEGDDEGDGGRAAENAKNAGNGKKRQTGQTQP